MSRCLILVMLMLLLVLERGFFFQKMAHQSLFIETTPVALFMNQFMRQSLQVSDFTVSLAE